MVRKRNKLILIQQEATDSKSNFSFFSKRKFFWVFFISHKIYPNYTILNISHSKLFLQEKIDFKYGTMVSPRFSRSMDGGCWEYNFLLERCHWYFVLLILLLLQLDPVFLVVYTHNFLPSVHMALQTIIKIIIQVI